MKDFFKSGKNIAILVLAIVLAGSVACNICLATRRCAPRGPQGHRIEQFHGQSGGPQGQMPQENGQDNNQVQPPQGQPPQASPNGQEPNAQAPQDGQQGQKKDSDKKGNNDDKKDNDDDDDKDEKTKTQ